MTTLLSPGSGMKVFTAQLEWESQVGYLRISPFGRGFSAFPPPPPFFFFFFELCLNIPPSRIRVFINLTTISSSDVFLDKNHVALRLSFVNVSGLNKVLRVEIFVSKDRQLRPAPLILEYEPLSRIF